MSSTQWLDYNTNKKIIIYLTVSLTLTEKYYITCVNVKTRPVHNKFQDLWNKMCFDVFWVSLYSATLRLAVWTKLLQYVLAKRDCKPVPLWVCACQICIYRQSPILLWQQNGCAILQETFLWLTLGCKPTKNGWMNLWMSGGKTFWGVRGKSTLRYVFHR